LKRPFQTPYADTLMSRVRKGVAMGLRPIEVDEGQRQGRAVSPVLCLSFNGALSTLFQFGLAIAVALAPATAQESPNAGLSLSVVGIRTKDYADSMNFYTKVMGFKPAFSFSPNGQTMNTYFQLSRDTFLELQEAPANTPSGFSHIHMKTEDVDASLARLRQAGVPNCTETLNTGCLMDVRIAQPTKEKSATIIDPSGIRIEPTQFIPGSLTRKAVDSWENKNPPIRLLVVGIAVKDYPESQKFYGGLMDFPVAFKFSSPDGQRTTTYYQISRDTFLEMQPSTAEVPPGITHVHMLTDDVNAAVPRLRQSCLGTATPNKASPKTVSEPGIAQPSHVKNANVFDANGLRLELNEWLPDSLTKKAVESWK
jgi:catechol 2,3-dioxygenase-like lactoylglutathione lyase family enzyme